MWSALYPISNHSHIRQLQFATHAFSQQVLQQAVQISICQWLNATCMNTQASIDQTYTVHSLYLGRLLRADIVHFHFTCLGTVQL